MSKHSQNLNELRKKNVTDLQKEISKVQKEVVDLRFQIGFGKINSLPTYRQAKKQLARLWTILGEKINQ